MQTLVLIACLVSAEPTYIEPPIATAIQAAIASRQAEIDRLQSEQAQLNAALKALKVVPDDAVTSKWIAPAPNVAVTRWQDGTVRDSEVTASDGTAFFRHQPGRHEWTFHAPGFRDLLYSGTFTSDRTIVAELRKR